MISLIITSFNGIVKSCPSWYFLTFFFESFQLLIINIQTCICMEVTTDKFSNNAKEANKWQARHFVFSNRKWHSHWYPTCIYSITSLHSVLVVSSYSCEVQRKNIREKCYCLRKMESILKPLRDGESVLDLSPRSTVGGGVEDVYGEDRATEDQLVTPWTFSVARSCSYSKSITCTTTSFPSFFCFSFIG